MTIPYSIESLRQLASERGGELLSQSYRGCNTDHEWRCSAGHQWLAMPSNVRNRGSWCPHCLTARRNRTEDMQRLAAKRGGKCLSEYKGRFTHLEWECSAGHRWSTTPGSVMAGSWCPHCARRGSSRGERLTRSVLESMFGEAFLKARPAWLREPGAKRSMELDGYAERIAAAFEYQGEQHFKVRGSRYTERVVRQLQERDAIKAALCEQNGVRLVVVRDFSSINDDAAYVEEVVTAVERAGLMIPTDWQRPLAVPQSMESLARVFGESGLAALREFAIKRGGFLLSTEIERARDRLQWRCAHGHEFKAVAADIRKGSWCPTCAGRGKTTAHMHAMAAAKGGEFLSPAYAGMNATNRWRCDKGHEWMTTPGNIQRGTWCPRCNFDRSSANQRDPEGFEKCVQTAESHGGAFLSDSYAGSEVKHRWRCDEGHEWEALPLRVLKGVWCPSCKHERAWITRRTKAGTATTPP